MSESIPVHWMLLVAVWVYDLTNAVVAALPPSVNTGWTTSPLMGYVYNVIATVVRLSVLHEAHTRTTLANSPPPLARSL